MSRIGKKPVNIPEKVKVSFKDGTFEAKGPLGNLTLKVPEALSLELNDKAVNVKRSNDDRLTRSLHGLYRSLINNAVAGVATGYAKTLDIVGVGYKAEVKGKNLELALGFSHPVVFPIPEGIKFTVDKGVRVNISGADKQLVGETASRIRKIRSPEPYKGKGVRYADEIIKKKVGKAATAVGAGAK
ncbi:MAG: 50S ribosomal protein L6 [Deltaproteobacteria bacterium]|nr:50S ribosomal protein L6 [Deltaproteobacteria bacterium]MBI2975184.1 50S ribosomal protein L6 [Deltaproteobacteria bacterium]